MLDDNEAATLGPVEVDEQVVQLIDEDRIDTCTGFVKEHQLRGRHERHRNIDELLLAVGKTSRRQMCHVFQPE